MTDDQKKPGYSLSLRFVVIIMFVIGVTFSILLVRTMYLVTGQYDEVESATRDYVEAQDYVYIMRDAIQYLNEHSRNFVVSGNSGEIILYFNEAQVQRSRDTAMEHIRNKLDDEQVLKHLTTAVDLSDHMMEIQYYAMRLAIEGYGLDLDRNPSALRDVELSEEDLAARPEDQLTTARELLFSKEYSNMKGQVDIRIDLCKEELIKTMRLRQEESSKRLRLLLREQRALIIIMTTMLLMVLIYVLTLVVLPISRLIVGIREERQILPKGSAELRFLTDTYNRMYEKMETANTRLSYEAAHDALTGLYNRGYYEAIRDQSRTDNIALLIVDVDNFKDVNDTWGHDIGDKVLIRVAQTLLESFRDADKVCRIGGDEFSVIMMKVDSSVKEVIRRKITSVSQSLRQADGDIPGVTISVGVAFSNQMKEEETLFKNADQALYTVKENGRDGCAFFPEEVSARQGAPIDDHI